MNSKIKKSIKTLIDKPINFFFNLFKIKEDKIFFETTTGEIKDNPKIVYDYLKKKYPTKYKLRWAVKKGKSTLDLPKEDIVYKNTLKYYFTLKTSKYWIRSHSIESIIKKRDNQIYIQLWHGPGATKKEGYDMLKIKTDKVIPHAKEWDIYIATDEDSKNYIKTSTNINIPRIIMGNMRTDQFYENLEEKRKINREKLGIKEKELAIIYAPTFREEDFNKEKIIMPIKKISEMENVRLILRLHPEVKSKVDLNAYSKNVIDGNMLDDIYDLYYASDLMITDYSSTAIEYSFFKKLIIFYMYDLEEYIKERSFYFNYLDNLGGPIAKTEDEVINILNNIEEYKEKNKDKIEKYYKKYNKYNDGKVCERFCDKLISGEFERLKNESR